MSFISLDSQYKSYKLMFQVEDDDDDLDDDDDDLDDDEEDADWMN